MNHQVFMYHNLRMKGQISRSNVNFDRNIGKNTSVCYFQCFPLDHGCGCKDLISHRVH